MSRYPMFQEIINEMAARAQGALPGVAEADPVGILEETISPLLDACNKINLWIGEHPTWDFSNEPPWYEEFITELARFDVDLSPIWSVVREAETLRHAQDSAPEGKPAAS